jgi:hypothetical protein
MLVCCTCASVVLVCMHVFFDFFNQFIFYVSMCSLLDLLYLAVFGWNLVIVIVFVQCFAK